jgi:hypothetical protein
MCGSLIARRRRRFEASDSLWTRPVVFPDEIYGIASSICTNRVMGGDLKFHSSLANGGAEQDPEGTIEGDACWFGVVLWVGIMREEAREEVAGRLQQQVERDGRTVSYRHLGSLHVKYEDLGLKGFWGRESLSHGMRLSRG